MFSRFTKSFSAGLRPGNQPSESWIPSDDFNSTDLFLWLDINTDVVANTIDVWEPSSALTVQNHELILWYDASDTSTITSSGGTVSALDNKSTYAGGLDLTAINDPKTGVDTVNSLNVITLNGNDDRFDLLNKSFGLLTGNMIVVGVSVIGTVDHERDAIWSFVDVDGTNNDIHLRAGHSSQFNGAIESEGLGSGNLNLSGGSTRNLSGGPYSGTTLHCTILDYELGDIFARMNGQERLAITNEYFTKIDLNNADFVLHANRNGQRKLEGKFCEIMVFEGRSESLAKKAEGYLAHKWGVTLPSSHPYFSSPPLEEFVTLSSWTDRQNSFQFSPQVGNNNTLNTNAKYPRYGMDDAETIVDFNYVRFEHYRHSFLATNYNSKFGTLSTNGIGFAVVLKSNSSQTSSTVIGDPDYNGATYEKIPVLNVGRGTDIAFYDSGSYSDSLVFYNNNTTISQSSQLAQNFKIYIICGDQSSRVNLSTEVGFFVNGTKVNSTNIDPSNYDLTTSPDLRIGRDADLAYLDQTTQFNYAFGSFDLVEILTFSHALTTSEREKVEGYLAHKYNLQGDLPLSHTYKSNPP